MWVRTSLEDCVVGKPQDRKPVLAQPSVPGCIVLAVVGVLAAVQLHDQPPVVADEVGDVRADGDLSAELDVRESPPSKMSPHPDLGVG
jgi:hypothetical protein